MQITWKELVVDLAGQPADDLLSDWRWLLPTSMKLHMVSAVGDAFVQDSAGKIHWLDTGMAELHCIAESADHFDALRQQPDYAEQWFVPLLVGDLLSEGHVLEQGQCFSYKVPPSLGGEFQPANFHPCSVAVHFATLGQIQSQAKGLPPGTRISSVTVGE